jgi:hypothetical protein
VKIFIVTHTTAADPHMPTILVFANEENARGHYYELIRLGYQSEDYGPLAKSDVQFEEETIRDLPAPPEVTEPTYADLYPLSAYVCAYVYD